MSIIYFATGIGTGLAMACAFVALNTFFDKKRGQAVGFSMAGTALGMMLMPQVRNILKGNKFLMMSNLLVQLVHVLLDLYGFRGTTLIVGGCALHSVVGSCLLRPLKEPLLTSQAEVIILIHKMFNEYSGYIFCNLQFFTLFNLYTEM